MVLVHLSVGKQQLTISSECWPEEYVFDFFAGRLFFDDRFLLHLFDLSPLLLLSRAITGITPLVIGILLNLHTLLLNAINSPEFLLFFNFLFEESAEIVVFLVLLIPLVYLHETVASVLHMVPEGRTLGEVPRTLVLAEDAHQPYLNFLLEVEEETFDILTVFRLGDEKPMNNIHVL